MLALVLFLLAVFAGGALLAPWLWKAVQALAQGNPAAFGKLARQPFARYVNRCLLLIALVGLPLYMRGAGIRRWSDVGFEPRRIDTRRFLAGFAIGFLSLALVCTVALAVGARAFESAGAGELAGKLLGALATAVVVAVLEELLFRGSIFGGLRRSMPWGVALVLSSGIYAIVHFMGKPPRPAEVTWSTGLATLPGMLRGFGDVHTLVPAFFSLTLAGVVLGLAYQWTGDLYASMGIHGGWIFWLKSYGALTRAAPGANERLWGSDKLIDGWFAFGMLVLVLATVTVSMRGRPGNGAPGAEPAG